MKNLNYLIFLISLLLLIITIGIFVEIFRDKTSVVEEDIAFCTVNKNSKSHYLAANDSINIEIGKIQFRSLCAFCHNKNMEDDLTGPALAGSFKRFNSDTLKFARYIRHSENYLQKENDKRIDLLHEKFGRIPKPAYKNLSLNEIKSIIQYIERY